jgi:hypothetical protein
MKRLMFALLALSLSASVTAEWVKVGENEFGAFFIDPGTIRGKGHFRKVWAITNMKTLVVEGARSYRVQWEYDCNQERSRVLHLSGHSKRLATGELLFSTPGPQTWEPTPPDTPDALIREIVCSTGSSVRYFNTKF